jgi:hypothetical protein
MCRNVQDVWLNSVLDKLAGFYVVADVSDRDRKADGVERFNARLVIEPLEVGESRDGGYRVAFIPLLMVLFHVNEASRMVRVTDVVRYGR